MHVRPELCEGRGDTRVSIPSQPFQSGQLAHLQGGRRAGHISETRVTCCRLLRKHMLESAQVRTGRTATTDVVTTAPAVEA